MVQLTILVDLEEAPESAIENKYEYLIAVSTDTLAVVNSKLELERIIIKGKDNNAFVCVCDDINHFLDCLAILEELITNKRMLLVFLGYKYIK